MQKMWKRMAQFASFPFCFHTVENFIDISIWYIYTYMRDGLQKSVTNFLVGGPRLKANKYTERDVCRHRKFMVTARVR